MERATNETGDLAALIAGREWYHTMELLPGLVTPGWFDTRSVASRLPWPPLQGKRCLDIGTFDGFWAFEMERRGAREVVGLDILDIEDWDWPAISSQADIDAIARRKGHGAGFPIAKQALGSRAERLAGSIYELDPAVHGRFDFVYLGSLLLHLRDPVGALERVREVCAGQLLSVDAFDVGLSATHPRKPVATLDGQGRPYWWRSNLAALGQMVSVAGFRVDQGPKPFLMPPGPGHPRPPLSAAVRGREARLTLLGSRKGDPHAWTLATATPARRPQRKGPS